MGLLPSTNKETESSQVWSLVQDRSAKTWQGWGLDFWMTIDREHMLLALPRTVLKLGTLLKMWLFGQLVRVWLCNGRARMGPTLIQCHPSRLPVIPKGACLSGNKNAFKTITFEAPTWVPHSTFWGQKMTGRSCRFKNPRALSIRSFVPLFWFWMLLKDAVLCSLGTGCSSWSPYPHVPTTQTW